MADRHPRGVSDGQDFEAFYAAAWPRLLRTTYAVTRDEQLAEDALQTAFAKAYAAWRRVCRADDPVSYVRRIAVNAAIAQHRKAFRRREAATAEPPERPVNDLVHEDRDEVWAALGALPPRQRAVIVLRYYEDLSEREIAAVLGVRPGTVKSHASAALGNLRQLLDVPAQEGDRT